MTRRVVLTRGRPTGRRLPAVSSAGSLVAALTVALVLGCLPACTADDDPDGSADLSAAETSSATPTPTATTSSAAPEDPAAAEARCQRAQSQAAELPGMWRVVAAVTASESGVSAAGARRVSQSAARIAAWLEETCEQLPPEARRYLRDVRRHTAGDFGHPELDQVLGAWLRWSTAVDSPRPAERTIAGLEACRGLMQDLSVTHRVWWRWTDTGRAWWIELTWDNRTGRTVNGETSGAVRVTGLLPDRFGPSAAAARAGPGRRGTEHWGGSSPDVAWVRPGVSSQVVAPGIDQDVHTTRRGTFRITHNDVFLYVPGPGGHTCRPPVPERS